MSAVADAFNIVCDPERTSEIKPDEIEGVFVATADVLARAITSASADCSSSGNAVGCAAAQAQASAWASATAEAHARAYAEAFNKCGGCDKTAVTKATASNEALASSFVELVADVYARAEVEVCVKGTESASAEAMSNCFADGFAKVSTQAIAMALVSGKCKINNADVFVDAVTSATYTTLESCAESTSTTGEGSANSDGTSAESVRCPHFFSSSCNLFSGAISVLLSSKSKIGVFSMLSLRNRPNR